MYGQGGGIVGGSATTAAGVAALPNTGGNSLLTYVAITAIVLGASAVVAQLAVVAYRRHALKQL
jgi:hypothetical protein